MMMMMMMMAMATILTNNIDRGADVEMKKDGGHYLMLLG